MSIQSKKLVQLAFQLCRQHSEPDFHTPDSCLDCQLVGTTVCHGTQNLPQSVEFLFFFCGIFAKFSTSR